jgi:hypothetical protein
MLQIPDLFAMVARRRAKSLAVAAAPLGVAAVVAGCGGGGSQSGGSASAAESATHPSKPTGHSSMSAMGGSGAMRAMPAAAHAELTLHSSHYGPTIFDAHHRVLYLFAADRSAKSTCYGPARRRGRRCSPRAHRRSARV